MDAFYGHLGIVEIDDQAAGLKELLKRPYVEKARVATVAPMASRGLEKAPFARVT